MQAFIILLLSGFAVVCQSGSIQRNKRGYLSRTGICVNPAENFKIKDPRLNFWGVAYVLPDDANPKCTDSECSEDSDCDADRKCCKNYCGGMVCTPTTRDPNPCKKFQCPSGQTCKVHYVPCVMPKCKDAIAVNRPTCIKDPKAPAAPPPAQGYPGQSSLAPSLFNQQQPQQYPPANQAPFMQQPMAPFPPAMPPMTAYQNDELADAADFQTGFTGDRTGLDTGLSDASLNKALVNENQPLAYQNDNTPPTDENNFLQPPIAENDQPLLNEPASEPSAASPMIAPQPAWDRSGTLQ
ncbi:uncharacterized protein [Montipora foliosa]|uniref:uncharacterized protein isoform X2 n=1 Tax=Montipora foliosa TaxID=591990 RepID=UPI0035F19D78